MAKVAFLHLWMVKPSASETIDREKGRW